MLIFSILLFQNQKVLAQSVLITPSKSSNSDTLSIQKKLVVGAKYGSNSSHKLEVNGRTRLNSRLFINSNGMPDTPNSNLQYAQITSVSESQDSSDIALVLYENSDYSPWLNFGKARGTVASPINVQNGDDLFKIVGSAYFNSDFYESGQIQLSIDGTTSATSIPTAMRFKTARVGQTGGQTSMSIRSSGNVGVGTDNPEQNLSVFQGLNIDQANLSDGTLLNGLRFGSNSGEGIASRRTGDDDSNYHGLDFYTNFNKRMTITNYGLVGIGTTNPTQAKLVVNGNVNGSIGNFGYLRETSPITGSNTTGNPFNYSIYASNRIAASEFNAFSDARIKNIKGISNNEKDLEILSKIQITDYQFKDKIGKGNGQYKKVIAQQVESIYPQAVNKITNCIPNIYQLTTIKNNFIQLSNHQLKAGERVKLIFDDKQEIFEVLTISDLGFTIANPDKINPNAQFQNPKSIFVYGREVSDFRSVDYEALSALNISATQALLKQINELKNQNEVLKSDLQSQKTVLNDLKSDIQVLKTAFSKTTNTGVN